MGSESPLTRPATILHLLIRDHSVSDIREELLKSVVNRGARILLKYYIERDIQEAIKLLDIVNAEGAEQTVKTPIKNIEPETVAPVTPNLDRNLFRSFKPDKEFDEIIGYETQIVDEDIEALDE